MKQIKRKKMRIFQDYDGYLTVNDIVEITGVHRGTVYRWISRGFIHPDEKLSFKNHFVFDENLFYEELQKNCEYEII